MSVTLPQQAEIGPIVTGGVIETGLLDLLKDWLPAYLCACEQALGVEPGSTPYPRGWAITGRDLEKYVSDQLPCVVVMSSGINPPVRRGGSPGCMTAVWSMDAGVIFNAAWGYRSRWLAQLYVRAIALTLLQRPLVLGDGHTGVVDFTGEAYDELTFPDTRTYSASVAVFTIEVEDMMWRDGGPPPAAVPPSDPTIPFEPWTQVREVDIEVTNTYNP